MTNKKNNLIQGTLELMILQTLTSGRMHGYGIVQRIHENGDELLKIEDGSLYPALYRMEERGWITSEWGVSEKKSQGQVLQPDKGRCSAARNRANKLDQGIGSGRPNIERGVE